MNRSHRRLRLHAKSVKSQLSAAKRKGDEKTAFELQKEGNWVRAQRAINAHYQLLHERRYRKAKRGVL